MKKAQVLADMWYGSAEYIVAHARWQASRGRKPSMSYGRIKNPRLALAKATKIVNQAKVPIVDTYIPQNYEDMTDDQFRTVAKGILRRSRTEGEFLRGLKQIQYPYHYAMTTTPVDVGTDGRRIGGNVMVMVMLHGHNDVISI